MLRLIFSFLCLLYWYPVSCSSWKVNFSELNWENASNWWGDRDKFHISTSGRLLLSDPAPGSSNTARLFSKQTLDPSLPQNWEFDLFFPFNPSSANHFMAGLYTAHPEEDIQPDGYYLQVGGQSGKDVAELFFLQGQQKQVICQLDLSWFDANNQPVKFSVSAKEGAWEISACLPDGNCFASGQCTTGFSADGKGYFSLNFRYTPGRNHAISIGYLKMESVLSDTTPADLRQLVLLDMTTLEVHFSEPVQMPASNESITLSRENAVLACRVIYDLSNPRVWQLICSEALLYEQPYRLSIVSFLDAFGNAADLDTLFSFPRPYVADYGDLVINEIMSDPHPPEGLPNAEYIEIMNLRDFPVDLKGWEIQVNQQKATLSDYRIPGNGMLLLFPENTYEGSRGISYPGLSDFPGLPNNGAYIALLQDGRVVDAVEYRPNWYGRKVPPGGISLEKRIGTLPGGCSLNWQASPSIPGGTPGAVNSQPNFAAGDSLFFADRLYLPENEVLEIGFSQMPRLSNTFSAGDFKLFPELRILAIEISEAPGQAIRLYFGDSLTAKTTYQLQLPPDLSNCLEIPIKNEELLVFALPETPRAKDLILNEILFDPAAGQEVFVELYNASDHFLDLRDLVFRIFDPENQSFSYFIPELSAQLAPDSFLILSPDRLLLKQFFPHTPLANCLDTALPGFPRQRGSLSLWTGTTLIDSIAFDEDWHHPFLSGSRGISLERIAPDRSGTEAGSWVSGSEITGFATPGLPNAAVLPRPISQNHKKYPLLHLSPDGDGIDDFLWISPETQNNNSLFNAAIFTWDGLPVKQIAERKVLTTDSYIRWDGDDQNGQPVSRGLYILGIEIFDPEGNYKSIRQACLLW